METQNELNAKILEMTMTINEKYPELAKYLGEMPVTIPDVQNPEINIKSLRAYYDSLTSLLENYILEHSSDTTK